MADINPHFLRGRHIDADGVHWIVYTVDYDNNIRSWKHRTPRAALRRLGSVIAGKLRNRRDHVACAVAPDGGVWNYTEIKTGFRRT